MKQIRKAFPALVGLATAVALLTAPLTAVADETAAPKDSRPQLWYAQPASETALRHKPGNNVSDADNQWQQTTLPIGNGRLGGTVWGEVSRERITFNEETLWTGGPGSAPDYNGGNNAAKGRDGATLRALNAELEQGADLVDPADLTGGEDAAQQGSYQNWGEIDIDYGFKDATHSSYRRGLDLSSGVADVSFVHDGTTYTREYFASHPDHVMVGRLTADKPQSLTLDLGMTTNQFSKRGETKAVDDATLIVRGALGNNGLNYDAQIKVVADGGRVAAAADGTSLHVSDADAVTFYVAAATDYRQSYPAYRTGESADALAERVRGTLDAAAARGYDAVRADHVADHSALFDRVRLQIGAPVDYEATPTDALLDAYSDGSASDAQRRALETLVYQYGRYLAIGSSREDSQLPSNLQGIWSSTADDNAHGKTPWGSDFHMNVNLQMNYWPVYSSNLAELSQPLIAYAQGLVEPGRVTAKTYAGAATPVGTPIGAGNGFMAHTENTAYGWTTPGAEFSWGWSPAAVPWLLQNVYEAYEYGGDVDQLRDVIYPLLKEESRLYIDSMLHRSAQKASDGSTRLTTGVAYSPEHGPQGTDGNTYESSLVWQLLHDSIEAARTLKTDDALIGSTEHCTADNWVKDQAGHFVDAQANRSWSCAVSLLKPIEVGESGQIKEWYFEGALGKKADGTDIPAYEPHHRHMSHLLGLFPGDLITVDNAAYMEAAKTSMLQRGDDSTGWGVGQRINAWARTGDGDHAYRLIEQQLKNAMYANLFDVHPPFQIDGNFGNTSGVDEMLMQSNSTFVADDGATYANYVNVLPALPSAWAAQGQVRGLVARGGFVLDIDWAQGRTSRTHLLSRNGGAAALKLTAGGAADYTVVDAKGAAVPHRYVTNRDGATLLVFDTAAGADYTVLPSSEVPAKPGDEAAEPAKPGIKNDGGEDATGKDETIAKQRDKAKRPVQSGAEPSASADVADTGSSAAPVALIAFASVVSAVALLGCTRLRRIR